MVTVHGYQNNNVSLHTLIYMIIDNMWYVYYQEIDYRESF